MLIKIPGRFQNEPVSFNMTPVIDIVFQLIIFFALVCQFIEAENFPVAVPDSCKFAQKQEQSEAGMTTVTVIKTARGKSEFAVGSEKVSMTDYDNLPQKISQLIDSRLKDVPAGGRFVTLRVDKDISFAEAQYALAGIAASSAAEIKLAVLKSKYSSE